MSLDRTRRGSKGSSWYQQEGVGWFNRDTGEFSSTDPYAKGNFNTPLGKAISYEMRHKPPGSDLVIANSSETIIPAAYGWSGEMPKVGNAYGGMNTGGSFDVGKVEVTINDNTGNIAQVSDKAAEMILQSMYRQARAEVYTS